MAEINIEKRSSPWPWIIGALALALVAWVAIAAMRDDEVETQYGAVITEEEGRPAGTAGTTGAVPGAVEEYSEFAAEPADLTPGRDHEYTAEGIRKLSAALNAIVERNGNDPESRSRFDRFRQSADRLERDPQSGQHAGTVRDVFTSAVDVLESSRVDAGDVNQLRQTTSSISADEPLLDQAEAVKRFFSQSAEALMRAARQSPQ